MSTNKTQHYQLHSWLPSDEFHVAEINENFDRVDSKLHEEVTKLDGKIQTEAQTAAAGRNALAQQIAAKADTAQITALNQAIQGLDGRKIQVLTGSYNSSTRIELGVRPLAVIAGLTYGNVSSGHAYIGMAGYDMPYGTALVLDESGFTPGKDSSYFASMVFNSYTFHYIVFY